MKWVKLQTFDRYVLWKNIQVGRYECFWPEIDPNLIVDKDTETDRKEPKKVKHPRPFRLVG